MKKLLSLLIILILSISMAACGSQEAPAEEAPAMEAQDQASADFDMESAVNDYFASMPDHIYKINQKEFVEMVKAGDDMVVLDIRQPDVYGKSHIKGAVNLPWGSAISDNLSKIPQDKPVFVYCYSGQTAGQAVATLNMAGFDARSVNLGWDLGISKVAGYEEATETESNVLAEDVTSIDPALQAALDEYYAGLAAVKGTEYANYKISEKDLKAKVDAEDDSIYILSIRDAEDFAKGHIKGASNIPWGAGMEKEFSTLPMDKKIVVYCYTGQTAGQTVAGLKLLGYDAVSLNGGMGMDANAPSGWANKGYEVVQ